VWILDLEHSGIASPVAAPPLWTNCPVWSPDGSRLVFASGDTATASRLAEKSVTGSSDPRALLQLTNACPLDWSRNGQFLLFGTSRDAGSVESGLWLLALAGQAAPKPVPGPSPRKPWAQISPNGRWIAYVSDRLGRNEVYVRPFPLADAGPWRVSSNGGIEPRWRADGCELFFIGGDQQLMAVPVTTEGRFEAGTPTALFATRLDPIGVPISGRKQYVVSADGMRFLLNQPRPDAPPAPITVVLNWSEELKQHVPTR
jgi:Tol biopolymer transport system component